MDGLTLIVTLILVFALGFTLGAIGASRNQQSRMIQQAEFMAKVLPFVGVIVQQRIISNRIEILKACNNNLDAYRKLAGEIIK